MRISDWSSDVCSSDLLAGGRPLQSLLLYDRRLSLRLHRLCRRLAGVGRRGHGRLQSLPLGGDLPHVRHPLPAEAVRRRPLRRAAPAPAAARLPAPPVGRLRAGALARSLAAPPRLPLAPLPALRPRHRARPAGPPPP